MKASAVITVAACVGCVVAFWLFGLAFTMNMPDFKQASVTPILVAFAVSLILVAMNGSVLKWVAIAMSAPVVALNALLFLAVLAEGRGPEWGHLITVLKVVVAVGCGAMSGLMAGRAIPRPP